MIFPTMLLLSFKTPKLCSVISLTVIENLSDQQRLRPACAYAQSDQSLCQSLKFSMTVKLMTEHNLGVLKLKRRLHRLFGVYTCQNATFLEIICHGSFFFFVHVGSAQTYFSQHLKQVLAKICLSVFNSKRILIIFIRLTLVSVVVLYMAEPAIQFMLHGVSILC